MNQIPRQVVSLPMLPMREDIIYPGMTIPFFIGRKQSMEAVERALAGDRGIFVITQKDTSVERPDMEDLFRVGTVGTILQIMRLPNGTLKALYEAKGRARLMDAVITKDYYLAQVEILPTLEMEGEEITQLAERAKTMFMEYTSENKKSPAEIDHANIMECQPFELSDRIAPLLTSPRDWKQKLLEEESPLRRLEMVLGQMSEEIKIRQLEKKMKEHAQKNVGSVHRDQYLSEQLKVIQKELGQTEDIRDEYEEYDDKIKKAKMPKGPEEIAKKELKKLKMMSPMSAEANVGRNYLDWLLSLPWSKSTKDTFDLELAQKILDEDHYGLDKVKERIVEYLAVCKLKGELKGPILCLVGPPGVGKTSLAKSISRAVGRKFARMSLGGIRDEAEIRGHRRTYIGAMPGKIIQAVKKAGSKNPVILMDEVDKLYTSIMGDPSAALLEVLDPEQNNTFMDHYIEVEYDLSQSLFICTANSTENISHPLLDRMEVISIPGYTEMEKINIAKTHLIPKQLAEHGLDDKKVRIREDALAEVVRSYTREAGVRGLEREIGKVFRKVVTGLVKKDSDQKVIITPKTLVRFLGAPKYQHTPPEEAGEVGITTGLGVTSVGGELLITEVETMRGKGGIFITGQLGEVMKESAQIAYSYVRSNAYEFGIFPSKLKKLDIHIHLPEGATPKDGPSAGITLVTSLVSALTGIPVRNDVAMTGELTLRGLVLQIGGLKEKLLAAKRGRIQEVIIPGENEKDLADIHKEILSGLKISPVHSLMEVIAIALVRPPKPLTPEEMAEEEKRLDAMEKDKEDGKTPPMAEPDMASI
ncbi:MAG: endopeptidase La [Deltaproteobacteria bacterium]|nr:endopeptidase La [Deltaproteobacteria bacterium]